MGRLLALLGVFALMFTLVAPFAQEADAFHADGAVDDVSVDRFDGSNRHDTACDVAIKTFGTADTVLLTRSDFWPDTLSGNYLAGQLGAPLLITAGPGHPNPDQVDAITDQCLEDLGTSDIIILGETNAVSQDVQDELEDSGYNVDRIGGENRNETAQLVAEAGTNVGTTDGDLTAIVASAGNFPDALVSGGVAYDGEFPLLLTLPDELDEWTEAALDNLNIDHVVIPGGTAAVSATVETQINAKGITTERLPGERRTDTATMVADWAVDNLGWDRSHINLARGDLFPDALALGPHSGVEQSGILLTWTPDSLDGAVAHTEDYLREHACESVSLHIAGGLAAVSQSVENDAKAAADDCVGLVAQQADGVNSTARWHAVDARLFDQNGDPVEDAVLVFEVYRDTDDDGVHETFLGQTTRTTEATPQPAEDEDHLSGDRAGFTSLFYNHADSDLAGDGDFLAADGDQDRIIVCHFVDTAAGDCTDGTSPDNRTEPGAGETILFSELDKSWVGFDIEQATVQMAEDSIVNPAIDATTTVADGGTIDGSGLVFHQVLDQFGRVINDNAQYSTANPENLVIQAFRRYDGGDWTPTPVADIRPTSGLSGQSSADQGSNAHDYPGATIEELATEGADAAEDRVFVCLTADADGCMEVVDGDLVAQPAVDIVSGTRHWVTPDEAVDGQTVAGRLINVADDYVDVFDTETEDYVRVPVASGDDFTIDGATAASFADFGTEAERGDRLEATFDADPLEASEFHLINRTGFSFTIPLGDAGFDQQGTTADAFLGEVPPNRQGGLGITWFETYTNAEAGGINEYCQYTTVVPGADQSSFEASPGAHLHEGAPIEITADDGAYVNGPVVVAYDHVSDADRFSRNCDAPAFDLREFEEELLNSTDGISAYYTNVHTGAFPGGLVRGHMVEVFVEAGTGGTSLSTPGADGLSAVEATLDSLNQGE